MEGKKEEHAAIYAQCRGLKPKEDIVTFDQQLNDCYSYCFNCGYTVDEQHVYWDVGEGDLIFAPELRRLRQAAAEGQIDVVVVASGDRIDELPAWQTIVIMELEKYGVRVESALVRHKTHLVVEQIIKDTDMAVAQILRERAATSQHTRARRKRGGRKKRGKMIDRRRNSNG